ncbi:hypothetical protein OM416_12835 [Paenibacillus sp. LS1]|uniref:hypothetical protein n=1 Tax=Paenibacillus sp. LS1 TaxID=2992120 RepID=UPI0022318F29|nr:hypothetical protein [Paenibacillus sp. LS1]MCW3792474.1 hypothetical protein [Paenibacillus sp. LS1]
MPLNTEGHAAEQQGYNEILRLIFFDHFIPGVDRDSIEFTKDDFTLAASKLGINLSKKCEEILDVYRSGAELPAFITDTALEGASWSLKKRKSKYVFKLTQPNTYSRILMKIFQDKYTNGKQIIEFTREEIISTAEELGIKIPKNAGDVLYSFRYRKDMPSLIAKTAPEGAAWIIIGQGDAKYAFKLSLTPFVEPNRLMQKIKIPDNTPEIMERYRLSDEQGLLSKVRYNRLIDIFLGITTYSLQNHLRTKVANIGQIEIDEVYVGINKKGQHYIIPVQAKGGKDKLGVVQLSQDIAYCESEFPNLICVPIAVQFMEDDTICMFHLDCEDFNARIVEERHYQLVSSNEFDDTYVRKLKDLL